MAFKDKYDLENLVNESERLVFDELENQLSESWAADICRCQDCILDMAALALNSMKPLYRVSLMGRIYASVLQESEEKDRARTAVNQAIKKISLNPSHGK